MKNEGAKRSSKAIDIVRLFALEVSINCVMCLYSPFQVIRHVCVRACVRVRARACVCDAILSHLQ